MLDANGNVIGIADQIATDGSAEQSSGVGFAVPIDLVKSSLKTLEAGGQVKHAYLGVATARRRVGTPGAAVFERRRAAAPRPAAGCAPATS